MARLRAKISLATGTVEIEGIDCTGDVCKTGSAPIEAALGIVESFEPKPELYVEFEQESQKIGEE